MRAATAQSTAVRANSPPTVAPRTCTGTLLSGRVARRHSTSRYGFIVIAVTNNSTTPCWVRGYPYLTLRVHEFVMRDVGIGHLAEPGISGLQDPGDQRIVLAPHDTASFAVGGPRGPSKNYLAVVEIDVQPFGGAGRSVKITQRGQLMHVTATPYYDFDIQITAYGRGVRR